MLTAFSPAARPTSTKLDPSDSLSLPAFCATTSQWERDVTSPRTPCSGKTSAERLNDFNNSRREMDKWRCTLLNLDRAKMRRYFTVNLFPAFATVELREIQCQARTAFHGLL